MNYEFLQSAGLLEDLLVFLNDAKKNENKALQDLTKSIDSLAHNISEKMVSFGKKAGSLRDQLGARSTHNLETSPWHLRWRHQTLPQK